MSAIIQVLNDSDLRAFPQKSNPKRVTMSFVDTDSKRYFLTRVANGVDATGKAKYCWAKGKEMTRLGQGQIVNANPQVK